MKIVDLTHKIHHDMPVYPGTKEAVVKNDNTIEKDGFAEKVLEICSHTGTHMDAPAHIIKDAKTLDDLSFDYFIGKAFVLAIEEQGQLEEYKEILETVDFVIVKTGWEKYWGDGKYFSNYPILAVDTVKELIRYGIKGLGFDCISVDAVGDTNLTRHQMILNKEMVIIENLCNLDEISQKVFELIALPLNIESADGAPIRAVARIEE